MDEGTVFCAGVPICIGDVAIKGVDVAICIAGVTLTGVDVAICIAGVTLCVGAAVAICTAEGEAETPVGILAIVTPCTWICGSDGSGALCGTLRVGAGASVGTTVISDADGTHGEAVGTVGASIAANE